MNRSISSGILEELTVHVHKLNRDQLIWLSGYIDARLTTGTESNLPLPAAPAPLKIIYGTHSGNAQKAAQLAAAAARKAGLGAEVWAMPDFHPKQLAKEQNVWIFVSTHGEGEPPLSAIEWVEFLGQKRAPRLELLSFQVFALGDSSYKKFCQTGLDVSDKLVALGARQSAPVVKLDTDFLLTLPKVLDELSTQFSHSAGTSASAAPSHETPVETDPAAFFEAELLEKIKLNGRNSDKETYHLEFSIQNSGIQYEPGDILEVQSANRPELVNEILAALNLPGDTVVSLNNQSTTVGNALTNELEITLIIPTVAHRLAQWMTPESLNEFLDQNQTIDTLLEGADLLDFIQQFALKISAQDLADSLRRLVARQYSISSSPLSADEEVHITVARVAYRHRNRLHLGVCSGFLSQSAQVDQKIGIRVKKNPGFKLPPDPQKPIILIGPGTGVAPFRAFLQHRQASGAPGKNWLFFGEQHFTTDFLYQSEWLKYRETGLLTRLDVAFSRDQEEKIYVQHRMKEQSKLLFEWIQQGAFVYVCGDKNRMARDVRQAFTEIVAQHANISAEEAQAFVLQLQKSGRYQEDIY